MGLVIESGFLFIESGVSIHPVELAVYQHPSSVSILPDCFIRILVSSLLVVVHPVGSLQVLVCCRGIPSVEGRPTHDDRYLFCMFCSERRCDWWFATVIATVCRGILVVNVSGCEYIFFLNNYFQKILCWSIGSWYEIK